MNVLFVRLAFVRIRIIRVRICLGTIKEGIVNASLFVIVIGLVALAGCATTQQKVEPINQVQNQVVDLQQRMEEQEKALVDLKYEVKEASGKSSVKDQMVVETAAPARSERKISAPVASGEGEVVLKVAVAASEVQKALKGAGLYEGKIDGKLGPRTKAAVVEFQKKHNLRADGVIGQKTWAELKAYLTE
jgi:murein L,D-transpeptidase YcbB/YkuD